MTAAVEALIGDILRSIESRDLDRFEAVLAPDVTWQNVPHAPAVGRSAVLQLLDGILPLCERVDWEIVSAEYGTDTAWLERVDRFWIDGECHAAPCNGVFVVDTTSKQLLSVRDYLDYSLWRERITPVLARRAAEDAPVVVGRHLAAVRRLDTVAMSADYARDATLSRPDHTCIGRSAISSYFSTVSGRMHSRELWLGDPVFKDNGEVTVRWSVSSTGVVVAGGTDTYQVESGRIVHQVVHLDGSDF